MPRPVRARLDRRSNSACRVRRRLRPRNERPRRTSGPAGRSADTDTARVPGGRNRRPPAVVRRGTSVATSVIPQLTRRARQHRADRVRGCHRDAGRHLLVGLEVKVGKRDGAAQRDRRREALSESLRAPRGRRESSRCRAREGPSASLPRLGFRRAGYAHLRPPTRQRARQSRAPGLRPSERTKQGLRGDKCARQPLRSGDAQVRRRSRRREWRQTPSIGAARPAM